jgi:hypothetical protein
MQDFHGSGAGGRDQRDQKLRSKRQRRSRFSDREKRVDVSRYFLKFLMEESCGKCLPCREGVKRKITVAFSVGVVLECAQSKWVTGHLRSRV